MVAKIYPFFNIKIFKKMWLKQGLTQGEATVRPGTPLANLWPHPKLYDEALCVASVDGDGRTDASGASQRRNCGALTLQVRRICASDEAPSAK